MNFYDYDIWIRLKIVYTDIPPRYRLYTNNLKNIYTSVIYVICN